MTGNVEDKPVHRLTANDKLKLRAFVREEDALPGTGQLRLGEDA